MRDIAVLSGTGVGGGSFVYANVQLRPPADLFDDPAWPSAIDSAELDRYYDRTEEALQPRETPRRSGAGEDPRLRCDGGARPAEVVLRARRWSAWQVWDKRMRNWLVEVAALFPFTSQLLNLVRGGALRARRPSALGQINAMTPDFVASAYPRYADWQDVHRRFNASVVFDGPFSRRVGISDQTASAGRRRR